MKHLIILGDGMADHHVERLGGKTLLQYANIPYIDRLAREGQTGMLHTIPDGFHPGSEVANTAILGYDLNKVYEGRGPLEAASIGYEMRDDDMAMRCNIISLANGCICNHHGGHLTTKEAEELIDLLNDRLSNDRVRFIKGIQYRHLLVIRGGNKHLVCAPPHDHPNDEWKPLLVKPQSGYENVSEDGRLTAKETADIINDLILKSQKILEESDFNKKRVAEGKLPANSIWPWSGGYRPSMDSLTKIYPQIKRGAVISAVDLIRGIGRYAGLRNIEVEGITGLVNTNYEGKVKATIEALKEDDFVFLHIEASDEAGHDGDLDLKLKSIEYLENRIVKPIYEEIKTWKEKVAIAILPDHPTPVELRVHVKEPVPFLIWYDGMEADKVQVYDEDSCKKGSFGELRLNEFIDRFMKV